jgi:putative ABC transport system permease protein
MTAITTSRRKALPRAGTISFAQSARTAVGALRANLLRALLTTLGIIIGTGAVVTIISVTEGNTASISSNLGALGPNVVVISPQSAFGAGGVRAGAGTAQTLTVADADAIAAQVNHVSAVSPIINAGGSAQIIFQNQNWSTRVQGVYPGYQQIGNWKLDEGSWFDQGAEDTQQTQAVIGATVAAQLFTPLGVDPVGQKIRIASQVFTVVGVLHAKGASAFGQDPDDIIYAPLSTVQSRLVGARQNFINSVQVQADSADSVNQVVADTTTLLEARHKVAPGADDFTVRNQNQITSAIQQTSQELTILLVGVASISLLVGGIGIMNIMLVTVTERTREIGIRIAIGARELDILTQFLLEAVMLTLIGGAIGIGIGTGIGYILAQSFNWPFILDGKSALLSFAVSALVGIVFGFYPAQRAARLDPIVALRTE